MSVPILQRAAYLDEKGDRSQVYLIFRGLLLDQMDSGIRSGLGKEGIFDTSDREAVSGAIEAQPKSVPSVESQNHIKGDGGKHLVQHEDEIPRDPLLSKLQPQSDGPLSFLCFGLSEALQRGALGVYFDL